MPMLILVNLLALSLLVQPGAQRTTSLQGSVTVEGIVVDDPVVVYLEAMGSRPIEQVLTDGLGRFLFPSIPPGTYYIRVKHEGFEEVAQRVELPAYNRDVFISLERKLKVPAARPDIIVGTKHEVDIRQLSIPEEAIREYQKALDENKKGKVASAVNRFRRALNIAPHFIEAASQLGSALYELGQLDEAERTLRRALTIVPKAPQLRFMLANVFVKQGKYQFALTEIDTYLRESPNGAERTSALETRKQLMKAMERE